nr:hypothetical protein [Chloroflexota bacterium]
VSTAAAAGQAIVLAREADGERALVAVNGGREPATLTIDPALLRGLAAVRLPGSSGGRIAADGRLELGAQGALILA